LLDGPAVQVETIRKVPMLSPAMQVDARVKGDKENKITKRQREKQIQVLAEAGYNERGNQEESSDSRNVYDAFPVEKSKCANEEVAKEARIIIWSAPDWEFLPVVKREAGRNLNDME
jgi:hypothetical protein